MYTPYRTSVGNVRVFLNEQTLKLSREQVLETGSKLSMNIRRVENDLDSGYGTKRVSQSGMRASS